MLNFRPFVEYSQEKRLNPIIVNIKIVSGYAYIWQSAHCILSPLNVGDGEVTSF